ncbi:MAG: AAA-like domain-containing protein [Caldilineaceae bacterium]
MRKFSSYGPIDTELHYYAPRTSLIDQACQQLLGENPAKGGHYITVWAPRQSGKTWVMQEALFRLQKQSPRFDVGKLNLQHLKDAPLMEALQVIAAEIAKVVNKPVARPESLADFEAIFSRTVLDKPLILIMDEFDALTNDAISGVAGVLRNIYVRRRQEADKPTWEKEYLLHSVALIGVRAVLGIENETGSPFNVQRSLHIPNLTPAEVEGMFRWYEAESGQAVEQTVIERVFYETQGQPGLVGWLGELLTETYNQQAQAPLTPALFAEVYAAALKLLPNNNILNIVSKAKQQPHRQLVLELFKTGVQIPFAYDDPSINFLYTNGVIAAVQEGKTDYFVKFANPFVQKRLFNYFAREIFPNPGVLYDPFADLQDTITDESLHIKNLMRRYELYLRSNRNWLFRNAPRRKTDDRLFEAVYHFNLYMYLMQFLQSYDGSVTPEFPTGNGKLDLLIYYAGRIYGLEVKSFLNQREYRKALDQAAHYAQQLAITEIALVLFVDHVDDANRQKFEVIYNDTATGVIVTPILVETGT